MENLTTNLRLALMMLPLIFLAGCSEPPPAVKTVTLSGTIASGAGIPPNGTVRVQLFHAWALEGILRHPLEEIESFETRVGEFSHEFAYPLDAGEGLVVHAWLDTDGDGVFCTPTRRDEVAGFAEVEDFPADAVSVEITLDQPCAAPNWFFPAAN